MADLLNVLLHRLFPGLAFRCIEHEGKQDLEKNVPRKLRAWREPGARFVVMRDQDSADCRMVKARLKERCDKGGRADALVRVVCRELTGMLTDKQIAGLLADGGEDLEATSTALVEAAKDAGGMDNVTVVLVRC